MDAPPAVFAREGAPPPGCLPCWLRATTAPSRSGALPDRVGRKTGVLDSRAGVFQRAPKARRAAGIEPGVSTPVGATTQPPEVPKGRRERSPSWRPDGAAGLISPAGPSHLEPKSLHSRSLRTPDSATTAGGSLRPSGTSAVEV